MVDNGRMINIGYYRSKVLPTREVMRALSNVVGIVFVRMFILYLLGLALSRL